MRSARFKRAKKRQKDAGFLADLKDELHDKASYAEVMAPRQEKTVYKVVPARAGDEIIGEAVIYVDGTIDIIANGDISPIAKGQLQEFKAAMLGVDVADLEED